MFEAAIVSENSLHRCEDWIKIYMKIHSKLLSAVGLSTLFFIHLRIIIRVKSAFLTLHGFQSLLCLLCVEGGST